MQKDAKLQVLATQAYYRRYEKLMAHWRRVLPQGRMLEMQYEDIVADVEREARRIIAHCGLGWDARCLSFDSIKRAVRTASAIQVRRPIYREAVGRAHACEEFPGPLIQALGRGDLENQVPETGTRTGRDWAQ
jgi:hypothetical protein